MRRLLLICGLLVLLLVPAAQARNGYSISIDQAGPYTYGEQVTFTTSGTSKNSMFVEVLCKQPNQAIPHYSYVAWGALDPKKVFTIGIATWPDSANWDLTQPASCQGILQESTGGGTKSLAQTLFDVAAYS